MQNSDEQQKIFVVLEAGAEWPPKLDFGGLTDVYIVAQQATETNPEFARRVESRLARAQRSNGRVAASVLVVGCGLNYSDVEARCGIARILATALTGKAGSELTLTGKGLSSECCAHLSALALVIEDELFNTVRIRIQAEPLQPACAARAAPRSGVFALVDPPTRTRARRAGHENHASSSHSARLMQR